MPIINRISAYSDDMAEWRQYLHAHPELGLECHQTAEFVVKRLTEFGVDEIHTNIATSGVVAITSTAKAMAQQLACVLIWMLCPSSKKPVPHMQARFRVKCMPVVMTDTQQCYWVRPSI